jgi:excisionase family DNA binding protein
VQVVQKLYTTETLAELLQVSPRTIRRERKEGRLPFVRVRGQIRYRESDVRSYLERNASLTESGSLGHATWGER